mmetsp:Transcript_2229/g.5795  ORF Transcript_2229/g.5795 Transcript_2229/m.5795 type:complete len:205 (+) Transcript_2229:188-802(+)
MAPSSEPEVAEQPTDASEAELVAELLRLQGQRAQCYAEFDREFRAYARDTGPEAEARYTAAVQRCTAAFADLSRDVNAVEEAIKSALGQPQLAAVIRDIQQHEKIKLEMTATLHVLKKAKAAKEAAQAEAGVDGAQAAITAEEEEPPRAQPHAHGGCCACGPPPPEPTVEELDAAIGEATQNIQGAVAHINEILEELRYLGQDD